MKTVSEGGAEVGFYCRRLLTVASAGEAARAGDTLVAKINVFYGPGSLASSCQPRPLALCEPSDAPPGVDCSGRPPRLLRGHHPAALLS